MEQDTENTSGQGPLAVVPAEIDHWNWGAVFLNWIWGLGNNTPIALLMFVPVVNLVMPFVLGAKGSAWAWRNKRWKSTEHFKSVQRQWAKWGAIVIAVAIAMGLLAAAIFFAVVDMLKSSDAYQLGLATVRANSQAVAELGTPISAGIPIGSIEISGTHGKADISFSVEGPKATGTVYVDALRDLGQWKLKRIVLQIDGSGRRIDLLPGLEDTAWRRRRLGCRGFKSAAET